MGHPAAGLKNVSIQIKGSAALDTFRSQFDKHTVVITVYDSKVPTLGQYGATNPLAKYPGSPNTISVSVNAVKENNIRSESSGATVGVQTGRVMEHELVHTTQGVTDTKHVNSSDNLMHESYSPNFASPLSDEHKASLQEHFNRQGEVDKDSDAEEAAPEGMGSHGFDSPEVRVKLAGAIPK